MTDETVRGLIQVINELRQSVVELDDSIRGLNENIVYNSIENKVDSLQDTLNDIKSELSSIESNTR